LISFRWVSAFLIVTILVSAMIQIPPSVHVVADSSDISECSDSFSGAISEPFNADPIITINSVTGDYNVEFDYAFAVGEEGTISFLKPFALEPSIMTFVEGETISTILTSGETILDGVMKLYHQDISDCEISFNSSSIPDSKRIILSMVSITDMEPSKFLVKAAIPDAESAKDFTKLVIAYVTNPEASVSYNIRNVAIVEAPDNSNVFCDRNIQFFDNVIHGTAKSDLINGTGTDDLIRGFGGDDIIDGKGGNDCLIGNGGNDILYGGPGDDSIYGGEGDDKIYGNNGNDVLYGNAGNDLISGGDGDDYIAGKSGDDDLFGNDGNDKMFGNDGDDYLKGGDGDDIMFGGDGNDRLDGNTGNDRLNGQEGDDIIKGQRGEDRLNGGEGTDSLDGGRDRDLCYDDGMNLGATLPLNCEEVILVNRDDCTLQPIDFRDINEIPPFVAIDTLTLNSTLGTYEFGLDYYKVEDGEIVAYLKDSKAQNPEGEVKFQENEVVTFVIGSTSPDVVVAYLVDESISDCDIVAGIPHDKRIPLEVIKIEPSGDFEYTVSAQIPNAPQVDGKITKLVLFYTESPETAVFYVAPSVEIVTVDRTRPEITVTQPANGTQFIRQSVPEITFLVTGIAFDSMSGINRVELALKDPYTLQKIREYQLATPTTQDDWSAWSYELTIEDEGDYLIVARAFDNERNMNWSKAFVSNILNTNVSIAPNASIPGNPSFVPQLIIVGIGDTVSWTNNDTVPHIVTSGDPRIAEPDLNFKSGLLEPGSVFEHTFADAGSYQYFCAIHPFMSGGVVVE